MEYSAQTYRNCTVKIDGNTYVGCFFDNTVLEYDGGPCTFIDCTFSGHRFEIGPNFLMALNSMRTFAHAGGPKAVKALVENLSAFIRRKEPTGTFTFE